MTRGLANNNRWCIAWRDVEASPMLVNASQPLETTYVQHHDLDWSNRKPMLMSVPSDLRRYRDTALLRIDAANSGHDTCYTFVSQKCSL